MTTPTSKTAQPGRRHRAVRWLAVVALVLLLPVVAFCACLAHYRPPALSGRIASPRALSHAGVRREWRLYVPDRIDPSRPSPLLLVLHGGGGTAESMERLDYGRIDRLADRDGWLVAYPDGIRRRWNSGHRTDADAEALAVDDVGFLQAVIDQVDTEHPIDRARVCMAGISNGAMMSFRFACERPESVAAIVSVAGSLPYELRSSCRASPPVSLLMIHGTEDPLVPWGSEDVIVLGRVRGRRLTVPDTMKWWASAHGCTSPPVVSPVVDRDPNDGTRVRSERYEGCRDGVQLSLDAIDGGGHTWPGGHQYLPERMIGRTSRDIDASDQIFAFCEAVGRSPGPARGATRGE